MPRHWKNRQEERRWSRANQAYMDWLDKHPTPFGLGMKGRKISRRQPGNTEKRPG